MRAETKWFGTIEVGDDKIINFEKGIIGFQDYKKFTIIYDSEKETANGIIWLQSLDDPALALPIIDPAIVKPGYDPVVEDELVFSLGDNIKEAELLVFVTLTVPSDITKMTCNLKAPIIINTETLKGIQLIADNEDYLIKYPIYDILKAGTEKDGE